MISVPSTNPLILPHHGGNASQPKGPVHFPQLKIALNKFIELSMLGTGDHWICEEGLVGMSLKGRFGRKVEDQILDLEFSQNRFDN